jgi:uncharacterized RDD family membrane protein YckC
MLAPGPQHARSTTRIESRPAGLSIRLAAMVYEGVLLFGVAFIAAYVLLALAHWTYPLTAGRRALLQMVLFIVIGAYFVYQWSRTGQTLAMKSWHLRLVDRDGLVPTSRRATLRYVLAWHLWLPGILAAALFDGHGARSGFMLVAGFAALFLTGLLDPSRRLLHDRLSGTRVVRES